MNRRQGEWVTPPRRRPNAAFGSVAPFINKKGNIPCVDDDATLMDAECIFHQVTCCELIYLLRQSKKCAWLKGSESKMTQMRSLAVKWRSWLVHFVAALGVLPYTQRVVCVCLAAVLWLRVRKCPFLPARSLVHLLTAVMWKICRESSV